MFRKGYPSPILDADILSLLQEERRIQASTFESGQSRVLTGTKVPILQERREYELSGQHS